MVPQPFKDRQPKVVSTKQHLVGPHVSTIISHSAAALRAGLIAVAGSPPVPENRRNKAREMPIPVPCQRRNTGSPVSTPKPLEGIGAVAITRCQRFRIVLTVHIAFCPLQIRSRLWGVLGQQLGQDVAVIRRACSSSSLHLVLLPFRHSC